MCSGLFALMTLKPLSQYARPLMPFVSSFLNSIAPTGPSSTFSSAARSGKMYGRSNTSNSLTPSGPNFASDGASICTAPSCSASISSLSL